MTYKEAVNRIEAIIQLIETDQVEFEELNDLIKEATILIKQCKSQLRDSEEGFKTLLNLENQSKT